MYQPQPSGILIYVYKMLLYSEGELLEAEGSLEMIWSNSYFTEKEAEPEG